MKRLESLSSVSYSLNDIPSDIIIIIFVLLLQCNEPTAVCFMYTSSYIKHILLYSRINDVYSIRLEDILNGFSYKCSLNGYSSIIKWAWKNGCSLCERTCSYAAKGGFFDLLKWLKNKGCPWNEWTCSYAAGSGYFSILKWARKHGCEWDDTTTSMADESNHIHILKWLIENGCPFNVECCNDKCIQLGKGPCKIDKFCYDRKNRYNLDGSRRQNNEW